MGGSFKHVLRTESSQPSSEQYWLCKNFLTTLPFLYTLNCNFIGIINVTGIRKEEKEVPHGKRKKIPISHCRCLVYERPQMGKKSVDRCFHFHLRLDIFITELGLI